MPGAVVAAIEGFPAAHGPVDLVVRHGEAVRLRGRSGAGKTSLLRALAGLPGPLRPRRVEPDPAQWSAPRVPAHVAFVPAAPLDGLVGLTVAGEFRMRRRPLPDAWHPRRDQEVATLSAGEARRLGLAVAAASPAPLLLLDEPAEGLDAAGREHLLGLVEAHLARGSVVFADQAGALDALPARTVDLAPRAAAPLPPVPGPLPPHGAASIDGAGPGDGPAPVAVEAPAARVALGATTVDLPAVRLEPGFHVVTGPNGCGKSTLLRRLAGLLPAEGVRVAGRPPAPGANVRLLPEQAGTLLVRPLVAEELRGVEPAVAAAFVPPTLHGRHPVAVSRGEAQRVALAKVLGRPAPLVLLDEPEAHLDDAGRAALVQQVAASVAQGACVVAATHDPALAALAHSMVRFPTEAGP